MPTAGEADNITLIYVKIGERPRPAPPVPSRAVNDAGDNFAGMAVTVCGTTNGGQWVCGARWPV